MCRSSPVTNGWHLISNEAERRTRVLPLIGLQLRCVAAKARASLPPTSTAQIPADPAEGERESAPGPTGCGWPSSGRLWYETFGRLQASDTLAGIRHEQHCPGIRATRGSPEGAFTADLPEARRDRGDAGASGDSRSTGNARRAAPCTSQAAKGSPVSDSGTCCVQGLHGPGRSPGTTARQPVRFPYAERVTAFALAYLAGVRICGSSVTGHAARTLPGIALKGGLGWRTG